MRDSVDSRSANDDHRQYYLPSPAKGSVVEHDGDRVSGRAAHRQAALRSKPAEHLLRGCDHVLDGKAELLL
jgi:hypothetical protein